MLTDQQMLSIFTPEREPYRPLVGFEYEIICLRGEDLTPLPYDGKGGLGEILAEAARLAGGELRHVDGEPVTKADLPDKGLLSLEPGGQFEFSSSPKPTFQGSVKQFETYQALLAELQQRFRLHCFFGGVNPVHTVDQIGLNTRTRRYEIMDAYFPTAGTMGRRMMRQTCSVHVTFDYRDAKLGQELLQTAQYISPLAAAVFANAPFIDGRRTEYRSYRVPIWANTDPARSGLLPGFTRPGYDFEDYLRHVVRAPMFFVQTPGGLVPAGGMTFEQFNREGFQGQQATIEDFERHNSTIFTDVRLKHTVEVRSIDCQDPALIPAVLALLSGILFCQRSRLRCRHLLGGLVEQDYRVLHDTLAREGIGGEIEGKPVRDLALGLIDLAAMGLPTCFPDGAEAAHHLDPVRRLVTRGLTPADVVLERFGDDPVAWLRAGRTFADGEL